MKYFCRLMAITALILLAFYLAPASSSSQSSPAAQKDGDLVYADFENVKDKRPYSNRGGMVTLTSYSENPSLWSLFKGLEGANPPSPESVLLKNSATGRAIAFEYELKPVNKWAGVGVEIQGQPQKDGKPAADDVSGYKSLTLDLYVTGVSSIRAEFISREQGLRLTNGYPQIIFRIREGLGTYKIELKKLSQPSWAGDKVNTRDVLQKLTAINLVVFCEQCAGAKGTVVVDNLVFHKE
jgi:hypothetical protein